jgi:hypothetical protein
MLLLPALEVAASASRVQREISEARVKQAKYGVDDAEPALT